MKRKIWYSVCLFALLSIMAVLSVSALPAEEEIQDQEYDDAIDRAVPEPMGAQLERIFPTEYRHTTNLPIFSALPTKLIIFEKKFPVAVVFRKFLRLTDRNNKTRR